MHHSHQFYHYTHNLFKNRELDELYVSLSFRFFALALINMFIPIYLTNLGFHLRIVMGYILIFFSSFFITYYLAGHLTERFGLKHSLIISLIPIIPYFILLNSASAMPLVLLLSLPVLYALGEGIFWRAFQSDFSLSSSRKEVGKQVSFIYFIIMFFMTIAPLLGAVIIKNLNYTSVFFSSALLLVFSIAPLLLTKDIKDVRGEKKNPKIIFSKDLFVYIGNGMTEICRVTFWPLFIYLSFVNIILVGKAFFVAEIAIAIVIIIAGWLSDKKNGGVITLRLGTLLNSGSWFLRLLSLDTLKVFAFTLLDGISYGLLLIPYEAIFYNKMRKKIRQNVLVTRQFGLTIGRILIICIVLITQAIIFAFLLAAFGTLFHFFFKDK